MSSRRRYAKGGSRDPGDFIAIPRAVLTCAAYTSLGHSARALLLDVASQYSGDNNGRLLCAWTFMSAERGWRGKHSLIAAKRELLSARVLMVETRMGRFPSTAAWYGLTWWALDAHPDMDMRAADFPRGAYRVAEPLKKNASLGADSAQRPPSTGADSAPRPMPLGAETAPVGPSKLTLPSAESALHLEKPSTVEVAAP